MGADMSSTQVHLVRRPAGRPIPQDFQVVGVVLPPLEAGEVRVSNMYISVDPYMRGRMDDRPSYVAPYSLGEAMAGAAIGTVIESTSPQVTIGETVMHRFGWRDVAQGPASSFRQVKTSPRVPISAYLGVLGSTGMTAYIGLLDVARMKPGETVFVSGAAGAVGSIVGQIARLKGAGRVIGSAGSDEKVRLLTGKYGYDTAFNYRNGPVLDQLRAAAPEGIDVYFDNVGGEHLEAALDSFNYGGRAALCGAISLYDSPGALPGPRFMENIIYRSLNLQGFLLGDYMAREPAFASEMGPWVTAGAVIHEETIVDGIEHSVEAFLGLLTGANTGKMLVKTN